MANTEYTTLLRCTSELISEISADALSISARLLAKGLIPEALHRSPKANELVQHVTSKVKLNQENYEVFISILSEFPWLGDIVKLIRDTYKEVQAEQKSKEHESDEKEKSQIIGKKRPLSTNKCQGLPEGAKKMCHEHQMDLLSYCNTCETKVCEDCIDGEHSQHDYLVPPERKDTPSSLEQIRKKEKELAYNLSDVKAKIKKVEEKRENVKDEVKKEIHDLKTTLEEREKGLLAQIDDLVKEKLETLQFQQDHLEMQQDQVKTYIDFTRKGLLNNRKSTATADEALLSKIQRTIEMPLVKTDFHFESTDLLTTCQNYGQIRVNPADPTKCYAEGVRAAYLNKETTIPIYTLDKDGNKNIYTSKCTDELTSKVVASATEIPSRVDRKEGTNQSLVVFRSHIRGMNHVQVKVNGENIQNIPCLVYVYIPTPTKKITIQRPYMLAVTEDKIVVVGDSAEHVNIYSKEWERIGSFKLEGKEHPSPKGVATDGKFLFITDKTNNSVSKYTFDGDRISSIGKKGSKPLEFNGKCGIAVNKRMGKVYIADQYNNRIQVLDSDLGFDTMFGKKGNQEREFDKPRDVAVANNGTIYVADANNNRVQVFKYNGEYIREFGNDDLYSPVGVCVDSNDHVLVADHDNNRVCVFNPKGELLFSFGEGGEGQGKFVDLYGIALDSDGKIYTADYGSNCVQIF